MRKKSKKRKRGKIEEKKRGKIIVTIEQTTLTGRWM